MSFLDAFHFIRPAWLLLAPFVVGIWWLIRRSQDPLRGWRTVMDRELLVALTVENTAATAGAVSGNSPPGCWRLWRWPVRPGDRSRLLLRTIQYP